MRKATTRVGAAVGTAALVAAAGIAVSHGISGAEPAAHKVTYTVTTGSELNAQIYYMATEPPSQAAFDADSSQFLTNVKVNVNPAAPWVFETTLNDPNQWAILERQRRAADQPGVPLRDRRGRCRGGDAGRRQRRAVRAAPLVIQPEKTYTHA